MHLKIFGKFAFTFGMVVAVLAALSACSNKEPLTLQPDLEIRQDTISISVGDLAALFVNNSAFGPTHRAGYNGIAELLHTAQDSNVFVPFYAGFNLEHIFDGDSLDQLFEPRKHPMTLYRKSEREVVLYQAATPISGVESRTKFEVVAPHYVDVTFTCLLHDTTFFDHGYAGLFWASYIQYPPDKKIYFYGSKEGKEAQRWIGAYSEKHGEKSTHIHEGEKQDFYFAQNFNATLASHFSAFRFKRAFYFGKFHNMALAFFFDDNDLIRFSQSPTGGGQGCPAWDFQYLIPDPQVSKVYSFKARLMYKPFVSNEDVLNEYERWINQN